MGVQEETPLQTPESLTGSQVEQRKKKIVSKEQLTWWERQRLKFTPEHEWKYYTTWEYWKPWFSWSRWMVLTLMLLTIITGTTNRVMFRLMLYPMQPYAFFLNQVTSFIYIPVFWPICFYFFYTGRIDKQMRSFPLYKFGIMGFLDATAGLFMTCGGAYTSGPLQLMLTQGAIPLTMLFTWIASMPVLHRFTDGAVNVHYRWNHYLGVVILIGGVFLSIYGQYVTAKQLGNTGSSAKESTTDKILGITIFTASDLPTAISGVYKEIGFKGFDLDVYYVNAWVATFQFFIGLLYIPVTMIPGFGGLAPKDVFPNLWDGAVCLFTGQDPVGTDPSTEACQYAWAYVAGYLSINIVYNVILLLMIKYGSAALYYVASAVILPAADICFSLKIIMGENAIPLNAWDWVGLVVVVGGLVFYRLLSESGKKKQTEDGEVYDEDDEDEGMEAVPVIALGTAGADIITTAKRPNIDYVKEHKPRSAALVRNTYLSRLGINDMPAERQSEESVLIQSSNV